VELSFGLAKADIIDQSNTNFTPPLFQNIAVFSPIGQSFTPDQPSLNFVDLFVDDPFGPIGGTLQVLISFDTIIGPLLGVSLPTIVSAGFHGPTEFLFPSQIPIVAGTLFVIRATQLSGDLSLLLGSSGGPNSTYPGGDEILGGIPQTNNDLWFAEGTTAVPEPSALLLLFSALAAIALRGRKGGNSVHPHSH
jgi:PEP-CTERM motif